MTRGRRFVLYACTLILVLLASGWYATYRWGVPEIRQRFRITRTEDLGFIHPRDAGPFRELSYNPLDNTAGPRIPTPWSYVTDGAVWLPFVISVEYGWMSAPYSGEGEHLVVFWFFGWTRVLHRSTIWMS
jgi:hypothetical protein